MTVNCINCSSFTLASKTGGAAAMATHGMGLCAHEPNTATYYGAHYPRQCSKFNAAPLASVEKRVAFLIKEGFNYVA